MQKHLCNYYVAREPWYAGFFFDDFSPSSSVPAIWIVSLLTDVDDVDFPHFDDADLSRGEVGGGVGGEQQTLEDILAQPDFPDLDQLLDREAVDDGMSGYDEDNVSTATTLPINQTGKGINLV